ncbi:polysaccharide deacetylase family protein [Clostridium psychrophilum]|uniref:polysaccharide deacetylase family protein n=1 Tax=Clostridium psychrophilum TaxID=132926 RepID=UPI001C0D1DAA|nr:polysaccharide deacetylase family protein [Clostridium psychrophilum]MBU3180176.1 polysaccharide deacetylase family protein [Clostridium psychrophilum]
MTKIIRTFFKFLAVVIVIIIGYLLIANYSKGLKIKSYNTKIYNKISKSFIFKGKNKISTNLSFKYNNESVPVLMYHSIGTSKLNPYVVSTARLNLDMKYLKDNGFTTLSTDELYDFMVKNKPLPKKSVLITFDDCYEDNYTNAFPILKKYNFKATIFVITGFLDKGKQFLTSTQLKEMQKNGIDIESHTNLHQKLGTYTYASQLKILKTSKEYLEKTLHKNVKYISYPHGSYNLDTLKAVNAAGYKMAFTTNGRWTSISNGILSLNRVFISGFHHSNSFKTRVNHSWYLFWYLF